MAITLTDSTVTPGTTNDPFALPLQNDVLNTPDPYSAELMRPALEAEELDRKNVAEWRRQSRQTIDKAALDFDNFLPGTSEKSRRRSLIRGVMQTELDLDPQSTTLYRIARRQAAKKIFGEDVGETDESFFEAVRNRAEKTKLKADFHEEVDRNAVLYALSGDENLKQEFETGMFENEAFKADKYGAQSRWRETREMMEEQYGDVLPAIRRVWEHLNADSGDQTKGWWVASAAHYAKDMDEDDREKFLFGLRDLATTFPTKQTEGALGQLGINLGKSGEGVERVLDDTQTSIVSRWHETIGQGGKWGLVNRNTWGLAELFGNDEDLEKLRENQDEDDAFAMNYRRNADFIADVRRIFNEDFDPIRPLAEEGSTLRAIEQGVYAAPGAVVTTALAAVPFAGTGLVFSTIEESERQKYRARLLDHGMSREDAATHAGGMATVSAVPQMFLEKLQAHIALRRVPILEKVLGKADGLIANRIGRGIVKFGTAGAAETTVELSQEIVSDAVQDVASAFESEIPGIEWLNGKDGHFDGYFNKTITTFVAVAPLGVLSAFGGMSNEKRAAAFKVVPREHRTAWGFTKEANDAIDAAETPMQMVTALENAQATRDPNSEEARAANVETAEKAEKEAAAAKELVALGAVPGVRAVPGEAGFELYNGETGEVTGRVDTATEAADMVLGAINMRERATQEHIDEMVSQIEGAQIVADETDVVQELEKTRIVTPEIAKELFPESAERIANEAKLSEIAEGGTGSIAETVMASDQRVLGAAIPRGMYGRLEDVTKLYAGSSIFTLVHEKSHHVRRDLLRKGEITEQEQIDFFRKLNETLKGKTTKDGVNLQFKGFDGDAVTETALDEAWAHFSEVMILRSKNGKKSKMRGLLNKNLSAMVKARIPGAQKFRAFIRAMKQFFGLNLTRAAVLQKAERDGNLDAAEMEKFRAMVMGETVQEQFEKEVLEEHDKQAGETGFSISPAQDAEYLSLAKDPKKNKGALQEMVDAAAKKAGKTKVLASFPENVSPSPRKIGDWVSLDTVAGHEYQDEYAGKQWRENVIFGFVTEGAWEDAQTGWADGQTLTLNEDAQSAAPVSYDSDGNVIPLSQRFDETRDEISFSISSDPWAETSKEITDEEGGNLSPSTFKSLSKVGYKPEAAEKTQITATKATYVKIVNAEASAGMTVLDFAAGRGAGTLAAKEIGKKVGFEVLGYELFSNPKTREVKPEFEGEDGVAQIPNESADLIINNAVLNVVPENVGREILQDIYSKLAPGGSAFVNVMSWNNIKGRLKNPKTKLVGPREVVTTKGTFQKGYTQRSLNSLVADELPRASLSRSPYGDAGVKITKPKTNHKTQDEASFSIVPTSDPTAVHLVENKAEKGKKTTYKTEHYSLLESPSILEPSEGGRTDIAPLDYDELHYDVTEPARKKIDSAIESGAIGHAADRLVEEVREMLKNPEISAGIGWYSRMRKVLKKALGERFEMFTHLLGATSAQTPVETNFIYSMEMLTKFENGDYDNNVARYMELRSIDPANLRGEIESRGIVSAAKLKKAKTPAQLARIWIEHYEILPRRNNGKLYGANSLPALQAISQTWLMGKLTPKTPQFAMNLNGQSLEATIDVWAARTLRRILWGDKVDRWRIQPKAESAVSNQDFALGQVVFREAAKTLDMEPDDLQALVWFGEKDVWDKSGWTGDVGAFKSSFDEAAAVFFPPGEKPRSLEHGKNIITFLQKERLVLSSQTIINELGLNPPKKDQDRLKKHNKDYEQAKSLEGVSAYFKSRGRDPVAAIRPESVSGDPTGTQRDGPRDSASSGGNHQGGRERFLSEAWDRVASRERGETGFSVGQSRLADSLLTDVAGRVRAPEARAQMFSGIKARIEKLKGDAYYFTNSDIADQKREARLEALKAERATIDTEQAEASEAAKDRLAEVEVEIGAMEGAFEFDLDKLTREHEKRIAKIGEDITAKFAHRIEEATGAKKTALTKEAKTREAERKKAETQKFADEKRIAKEKIATERAKLETSKKVAEAEIKRQETQGKHQTEQRKADLDRRITEIENHDQMSDIRHAIAALDAIVLALPIELRGKIGGFTQISKLNTEKDRLEFLVKRLDKIDKVVEKWIQGEYRKQIGKLFDRARPKKTGKGVPKSNIAADFADRAMAIERMSEMTTDEVADKMDEIQVAMTKTTDQAEVDSLTGDLVELMSFGNIDGMNSVALESFFSNLNSVVETGKVLKEVADAEFKAEADEVKAMVNHDATGGGGPMTSSQAKRRAKENKRLKALNKFHRQNISFEWLMNNLARENKSVGTMQSETHKRLSTMVHVATHEEKRANMAMQTRYQETLSGILGVEKGLKLSNAIGDLMEEVEQTGVIRFDYQGKGAFIKKTARASNIEAVLRGDTDLDTLGMNAEEWTSAKARYDEIVAKAKNGKVKGNRIVEYQSPNVGTPDNLTLSQSQAINLTMLFRQDGLKESMIHEGYTEDTMKEMENFLSPESKKIRDWLTQEYAENYHVINKVFKETNGVSLPQTEHYSPARRLTDGKVEELSIDSRGGAAMSTNPNFTISRTKNFAEVDQTADALSVYMQHMAQTNHYVSWAKPTKMLRTVFSDRDVKKNISDYAGDSLLEVISERIEWMADGGNRKATHLRWLDTLRTAHTYSALAYNWGVGLKQLTSLPAYAFDMSFKDFGKYAAKFMKHPIRNILDMASTDYVKTRFKEGYERDVIDGLRNEGGVILKGLKAGMLFGKAGDIIPVMVGGWMARQRSYDAAIASGMSEADAVKKSTIDFEMSTDRAQQAGDLKDLSTFQGGGSIFKLFTMYKTSPRQYYANVYESFLDAKAGKTGSKKELGRRLLIGQIILPLTFQFASDTLRAPFGDDDDETYEGADYVRAMLLGPLNGLFLAGDFLELITSGLTDTAVWAKKIPIMDGATKAAYGVKDFWDGEWLEGIDDVARGLGKTLPSGLTFYDIIRKELKRFGVGE